MQNEHEHENFTCVTYIFHIYKNMESSTTRRELRSVRSWIYLIAFAFTSFLIWDTICSFPILFVAFLQKFQNTRSQTVMVGSLQGGLLFMLTVIPGYLIPRCGFKIIVMSGSLIMAIGFVSSAFVPNVYYMYGTIGIVSSLGASFVFAASESAPLVVFKEKRTTVTIASCTTASVGIAVFPLFVDYLIKTYALSGTLLLLAGIILQGAVLGLVFPPYHNVEETRDTFGGKSYLKILQYPSFWCLVASEIRIDSLASGCRTFLIDSAISNGILEYKAVFAMTFMGLCSALGKLLVHLPLMSETCGRRQLIFVLTSFCWSVTCFVLVVFPSLTGLVFYCVLAGFFHGVNTVLFYLVLADTIPSELVVPAYSLLCFIGGIYVLAGIPLAGLIFDETESYNVPYITYGVMGVCATAIEAFVVYFERKKNIQKDIRKELQ